MRATKPTTPRHYFHNRNKISSPSPKDLDRSSQSILRQVSLSPTIAEGVRTGQTHTLKTLLPVSFYPYKVVNAVITVARRQKKLLARKDKYDPVNALSSHSGEFSRTSRNPFRCSLQEIALLKKFARTEEEQGWANLNSYKPENVKETIFRLGLNRLFGKDPVRHKEARYEYLSECFNSSLETASEIYSAVAQAYLANNPQSPQAMEVFHATLLRSTDETRRERQDGFDPQYKKEYVEKQKAMFRAAITIAKSLSPNQVAYLANGGLSELASSPESKTLKNGIPGFMASAKAQHILALMTSECKESDPTPILEAVVQYFAKSAELQDKKDIPYFSHLEKYIQSLHKEQESLKQWRASARL